MSTALFSILFIYYFFIDNDVVESKSCVFKASQNLSRSLFQRKVPFDRFRQWFTLRDIPTRLIKLNPGVEAVEQRSDFVYKGFLKPLEFPWTKIYSTIEYDVDFIPGEKLSIDCQQESIEQIYEGPKMMVDAISSLKLGVTGKGAFSIDEDLQSFNGSVSVLVSFPMPDFYPGDTYMVYVWQLYTITIRCVK